jgi:glycosyltransferase involved in cell wall biosynthesis
MGVASSSSEFVAFLDADDEWLPDAAAELLAAAEAQPDVGLVSADKCEIDESGDELASSYFEKHRVAELVAGFRGQPINNAMAHLATCNFINTSLALVPSRVFRKLGGFREDVRYGEDLEFWLRIAARYSVIVIPRVLGRWRVHGGNATRSTEPMLKDLVRVSEIVREWGGDFLREQGLDANAVVARARTDLGYWYFSQDRLGEARRALGASLRDSPSRRALFYAACSLLPAPAVRALRTAKQRIEDRLRGGGGADANAG